MKKIHNTLNNQLKRLDVNLNRKTIKADKLQELLALISDTYDDYENSHYLLERNIEILTKEMDGVEQNIEHHKNLINSITKDGIILTDSFWNITYINNHSLSYLNCDKESLLGQSIFDVFSFFNARKVQIDPDKFIDFFECGNAYQCSNGLIILNNSLSFFAGYSFTPIYQNGGITEFAIHFKNKNKNKRLELRNFIRYLDMIYDNNVRQGQKTFFTKQLFTMMQNNFLMQQADTATNDNQLRLFHYYINGQYVQMLQTLMSLEKGFPLFQQKIDLLTNRYLIEDTSDKIKNAFVDLTSLEPVEIDEVTINYHSLFFQEIIYFTYYLCGLIFDCFKNIFNLKLISSNFKLQDPETVLFELSIEYSFTTAIKNKKTLLIDYLAKQKLPFKLNIDYIKHYNQKGNVRFIIESPYNSISFLNELENKKLNILYFQQSPTKIGRHFQQLTKEKKHKIELCDSIEKAIERIKYNRLNRSEYQLLVFDQIEPLNVFNQLLGEVKSYINHELIAIIFIHKPISIPPINHDIEYLFISENTDRNQIETLLSNINSSQIIKAQQEQLDIDLKNIDSRHIVFMDMDEQCHFFSTKVLQNLGLKFQYHLMNPHGNDIPELNHRDNLFINASNNSNLILGKISQIKKRYPEVPVFLISSYLEEYERIAFLNIGVSDFLFYPYQFSELIHFITTAVNKSPKGGTLNQSFG